MFELIDTQLEAWAKSLLGNVPISFAPPPQKNGVNLYLMSLDSAPVMRGISRSPLRLALHYLVTCWHQDPVQAHALLSEIVFAAIESDDYEVLYEPITPELWLSLGIAPQPSFVLRVIVSKDRPEPIVPRVREPKVDIVPSYPLIGKVLGTGDIPIVGAYVQIPTYQISQRSNAKGEFRFPNIVGEEIELLIRAKGIERLVSVNRDDDPIIIRIESL